MQIFSMLVGAVAGGSTATCNPEGNSFLAFDTKTGVPDSAYIISGVQLSNYIGGGYVSQCPYFTVTTQYGWSRRMKIGDHGDE